MLIEDNFGTILRGEIMTGLEFIIKTYGTSQTNIAEQLGIKKQNISRWLSGAQAISKRHVPQLAKIFDQPESLVDKQLTYSDEIKIIDGYKRYKNNLPKVPEVFLAQFPKPQILCFTDADGNLSVIPMSEKFA